MISIKMRLGLCLSVVLALVALTGCQSQGEKLYDQADVLKSAAENIAETEARNAKFNEAIDLLQQAIELEPRSAKSYHKLGQCYKKIEDFDNAISALEKALELDDSNWRTYDQLLSVRIKANQLEQADKLLQDMKELPLFQKDARAGKALQERQEEFLALQRGR